MMLEFTTAFKADELHPVTRIPAMVMTPNNYLLIFCEARQGVGHDWVAMDMLMRRSADGGRTWEPSVVIAGSSTQPVSNCTPIVDQQTGVIHLLYQIGYDQVYYIASADDGATWSAPRDITATFEEFRSEYNWKVVAPGPGHAIQLKTGRLLVPLWLCEPDLTLPGGDHRPSCTATVYSDDHGTTWQRGEIVANTDAEHLHPSECVLVELSDGSVMLNMRTESACHRRLISISPNGINQWSTPTYHNELFEPVCMASLLRIDAPLPNGQQNLLLFCNPDSRHRELESLIPSVHFCERENLTLRVSFDDGCTWPIAKVLEPESAGYSDLAVGSDGTIYCLYETVKSGKPDTIILACFDLEWLLH